MPKKKPVIKFEKDQELICTHYKNKPVVHVVEHRVEADEVWVRDGFHMWWGPKSWFKVNKGGK